MPNRVTTITANVDSGPEKTSCDGIQNPTKDDTMILLLCEKLIESGEVDRDPETGAMVDKHLGRLREKYSVDQLAPRPPHLRSIPTDSFREESG